MDRIDRFRIFARVVECTSFTRAADTLGLPRSSVSAAVQDLEKSVGVRLLHRTTRRVSPTQDGLAFYERCARLVADTEEAEGLFRQGSAQPAGRLRINVPARIGRLVIAPALPGFLELHPRIEVDMGVTDRSVNLIEENVDCVLRVGVSGGTGLVGRPIGRLALANVASPAYLRHHGVPQKPEDLASHWVVGYASPTSGRLEEWEWFDDGMPHTLAVRSRVTVNNAEAYIACCLAGLGLIQIPAYDVRPHIERGELVEVLPAHRAEPMPMTLLYPQHRHLSGCLRALIDWLVPLLQREILEPARS